MFLSFSVELQAKVMILQSLQKSKFAIVLENDIYLSPCQKFTCKVCIAMATQTQNRPQVIIVFKAFIIIFKQVSTNNCYRLPIKSKMSVNSFNAACSITSTTYY